MNKELILKEISNIKNSIQNIENLLNIPTNELNSFYALSINKTDFQLNDLNELIIEILSYINKNKIDEAIKKIIQFIYFNNNYPKYQNIKIYKISFYYKLMIYGDKQWIFDSDFTLIFRTLMYQVKKFLIGLVDDINYNNILKYIDNIPMTNMDSIILFYLDF